MKTILSIFITLFVISPSKAQFHNFLYSEPIELQKELLIKENINEIITSYYYLKPHKRHLSNTFIYLNSAGNIQEKKYYDYFTKEKHSYTYNESNNLESKNTTTKRKKSTKYDKPLLLAKFNFSANKYNYTYDNKNRLIEKKSCKKNKCEIDYYNYIKNKTYKYHKNIKGNLLKKEISELKDSVYITIGYNNDNKIIDKSITYFDHHSIKSKKNNVVNKQIKRVIKYQYSKRDSSTNISLLRYEHNYDEKGLLSKIDIYTNKKPINIESYKNGFSPLSEIYLSEEHIYKKSYKYNY